MALITDFHPGTTKQFTVECQLDGVAQDITSDTVTVTIKDVRSKADTDALLQKAADVASQGAQGIAIFTLTTSDTEIAPGYHYIDVEWVTAAGAEYVVYDERIKVLTRVSDQ
jgi:hypothetical protein